ncbi:hypothetical protein ACT2FY_36600 [Paraburkholderia fungorum]|uniref:hypothetical protein n=1 Tax=Paraburkholderia fungorum TaxID=134537 RepID=UPI00402B859C
MKTSAIVVSVLAILAAVSGVRAAMLLHKSTRLDLHPGRNGFDSIEQPGAFEQASQGWPLAKFKLNEQAAILNRKAAWWAIAAAVLGALATILELLPLP